mgnify:FL=1
MSSNEHRGAVFIGSDVYRRAAYGSNHPLTIPRVGPVTDLCCHMGWLNDENYIESPSASTQDLSRFHARPYIDAVKQVDRSGKSDNQARKIYGLGTVENPVFTGLFERAAMSCGGSIHAAEWVLNGGCAYNPAGGTHHGQPAAASGFCYFNDPVLAIYRLIDAGFSRILYLDLDAHHGDGVEAAFLNDARVATISIHERGRWPYSGVNCIPAKNIWNFPVPSLFNGSELGFLMDEVILPLAANFSPEAAVLTCGADGLAGDPLSNMQLNNVSIWSAVSQLCNLSPRTVVLGGGGYNPWTVIRCWAGLWATIAGYDVLASLTAPAIDLLGNLECDLVDEDDIDPNWLISIADQPEELAIRQEIKKLALLQAA